MNSNDISSKLNELDNYGVFKNIENMKANQTTTFDFDDVKAIIIKDSDYNGVDFNLVTVDFKVDGKSVASTYDISAAELKAELTDIMVNENSRMLIDENRSLNTVVNEANKENRHKQDLFIIND